MIKDGALFSARFAYNHDSGDLMAGLSCMLGNVYTDSSYYKRLAALDITGYAGLAIWRLEAVIGSENDRMLSSLFLGYNYALSAEAELNIAAGHFNNGLPGRFNSLYSGITLSLWGFQFRAAYKYYFTGGEGNEILIQCYRKFNTGI